MSEDPAIMDYDNLVADLGEALRERDEALAEVGRLAAWVERESHGASLPPSPVDAAIAIAEGRATQRDAAVAQRDALGVVLRRVVGRAREWGDFDATDFGDALREADEALAGLGEE